MFEKTGVSRTTYTAAIAIGVIALSLFMAIAFAGFSQAFAEDPQAEDFQAQGSLLTTQGLSESDYLAKANAFVSQSPWNNGASWPKRLPALANYQGYGCVAYACDFTKYVFGIDNYQAGTPFYSPAEIRSGDVIHISGHTFVVLERKGNNLRTAEGAFINNAGASVVRVADPGYVVSGSSLSDSWGNAKSFEVGYHFDISFGCNPEGSLDSVTGGDGTVSVGGWALDRDNQNANIEIHVYIGGPAGSNGVEGHPGTIANGVRADVNSTLGVSGNHGFNATLTTSKRGTVPVYAYGINIGSGGNSEIGTKTVTILEPKGSAASISEGTYVIRSKNDKSKVLDIAGGSTADGANVQLYSWNGSDAQKFTVESAGDGSYYLISKNSGKAVEVPGASTANAANVAQYTFNQTYAQRWFFDKNSDGTYTLRNRVSGLAIDATGGATADGTNIDQYAPNGTYAQRFYFERLDAPAVADSPSTPATADSPSAPSESKEPSDTLSSDVSGSSAEPSDTSPSTTSDTAIDTIIESDSNGSSEAVVIANPLRATAKAKTLVVKYSKLKKKNQAIAKDKAFNISDAQGKVTFKKKLGNKKIAVSSAGKIIVKKD